VWSQQTDKLSQWLILSDTAPVIRSCILSALGSCLQPAGRNFSSPLCSQAARDQDQIGFFGFMVGCLANSWQGMQANHYFISRSKRLAHVWLVCLCCQILQFTHEIWLARNHHLALHQQQQAITQSLTNIEAQFQQGTMDLLPEDPFYVTPGHHGFSLAQVLALPFDDQQLWLHSVQNARPHTSPPATSLPYPQALAQSIHQGLVNYLPAVRIFWHDGYVFNLPSLKFVTEPNLLESLSYYYLLQVCTIYTCRRSGRAMLVSISFHLHKCEGHSPGFFGDCFLGTKANHLPMKTNWNIINKCQDFPL